MCPPCGLKLPYESFFVRLQGAHHYLSSSCRECGPAATRAYRSASPEKRLIHSAKARAKTLGVEFSITEDDVVVPAVCPVLGIPLVREYTGRSDNTPSVDRKDPSIGYTPDNVRVVSWRCNRLKSDATPAELRRIAVYANT